MAAKQISAEAFRYLLVGLLNTGLGLSLIFACLYFWQMSDVAANLVGYSLALLVSYVLHRTWTFRHQGAVASSLPKFVVVTAVAYLLNLGVVLVAHRVMSINVYVAQVFGVGMYVAVGYLGNRYVSFRVESR